MIRLYGILTESLPRTEDLRSALPVAWVDVWQKRHSTLAQRNDPATRQSLGGLWLLSRQGVTGQLDYTDAGRPRLCDCPNADFNLSHSRAVVCCAFSECASADPSVGVDAEDLSRVASLDCLSLARRWFSEQECDLFHAEPSPLQFLRLWTRKEALLKRFGQGLAAMRSADTVTAERQHNVRFAEYRTDDTLVTLCYNFGNVPPPNVQWIRE